MKILVLMLMIMVIKKIIIIVVVSVITTKVSSEEAINTQFPGSIWKENTVYKREKKGKPTYSPFGILTIVLFCYLF